MYGGTCINIGCIPTKKLIHTAADAKKNQQADYSEKIIFMLLPFVKKIL